MLKIFLKVKNCTLSRFFPLCKKKRCNGVYGLTWHMVLHIEWFFSELKRKKNWSEWEACGIMMRIKNAYCCCYSMTMETYKEGFWLCHLISFLYSSLLIGILTCFRLKVLDYCTKRKNRREMQSNLIRVYIILGWIIKCHFYETKMEFLWKYRNFLKGKRKKTT